MKPFDKLSHRGKLRRLRHLAQRALAAYSLDDVTLRYHAYATNLLYRVTDQNDNRYMLRLASPGWRTRTDLRSEAIWLDALARDTGIPVPRILHARNGEQVVPISAGGVPDTWHACLMTWVPGRELGHYLTPRNLTRMGALFAQMHAHGAAWSPPAGFTTRTFEHWLSRGERNRLTPETGDGKVDSSAWALIARMQDHVENAYACIDRSDLRVIHCDLWHGNIKLHRGVLHPLDFEDTIWGFRAHDIAMAMLDLMKETGATYPSLLRAFRGGYVARLPWPEVPIEPLQIGRMLWTLNWIANHQRRWLPEALERRVPNLMHYEKTGELSIT